MLIDLSHEIGPDVVTYRGIPAPVICDYLSREASRALYAPGTEFHIARVDMVVNTGTYLDCPFHRFSEGADLAQVALSRLADLPGVVVRLPDSDPALTAAHLADLEVTGRAVLVHTGWSRHWNTEAYFTGHPYVTDEAAALLVSRGAVLVGIDSHNIDDTATNARPVHTRLLGAGVLIVEHLCGLDQLPAADFTFTAVPPKLTGVGTFPVRAFARVAAP